MDNNNNNNNNMIEAVTAVSKYGSIASAAQHLGLSPSTLRDRYNKAVQNGLESSDDDTKMHKLKVEKTKSDQRLKELTSLLSQKTDQLDQVLKISDVLRSSKPEKIKVTKAEMESCATAVLVFSDAHLEEVVDPKTVEDMNKYNLEVAQKRITKFFQNGLKLVEMCRSKSKIENLVLAVLGDMISGHIHQELMESNELSPTEAILKAYDLLVSGIDFLIENGKFKKILIPMCFGNHGRTTIKPRVATAAENSYEWMLYHFLANKYKDHPTVQIKITDGYFNYVDIYGFILRFHHGDNVQYQGGVGGLSIPLNKAIAQWNKFKRADIDILGHWHQRLSGRDFVVNGSVIGFNAYAIKIKASYEPPQQTFFLMHPRYGKCVECPIWLEE